MVYLDDDAEAAIRDGLEILEFIENTGEDH
jgi:hypothetical protein